jgi:hypothetical protein
MAYEVILGFRNKKPLHLLQGFSLLYLLSNDLIIQQSKKSN